MTTWFIVAGARKITTIRVLTLTVLLSCGCGQPSSDDCEGRCSEREDCCEGNCVDLRAEDLHCGECGNACDRDRQETCAAGRCLIMEACGCLYFGMELCRGNCVDYLFSPMHCGGCSTDGEIYACPETHACYEGACRPLQN